MARRRREPLSSVDTAWLRMEDRDNLMMITGVMMFDQPLDYGRVKATLEERLLRWDRFRSKIVEPKFGSPYWEVDPTFDIDNHLRRFKLPPPGDKEMLERLVSHLMSMPLDLTRSPWEYHLVEGYGQGSALIGRIHHSMADGIALIGVLLGMTDSEPDAAWVDDRPQRRRRKPGNPLLSLMRPVTDLVDGTRKVTESVVNEGVDLISHPDHARKAAEVGLDGAVTLARLVALHPDPPTSLKGPLGPDKHAAWSDPIPLDDVKTIGRAMGGTVNDVLLTAVAGALRRYLLSQGDDIEGKSIRAVVPVNLRPPDAPLTLGNRFGLVFLDLPIGTDKPLERLYRIKARMDEIKTSPEAVVVFGLLNAVGMTSQEVQGMVIEMFGAKGTGVMTNVPGPRQTIYLAGRAVKDIMFWVPQSGRLGLGVSILSYAGDVVVGVATDAGLVPHPEAIVSDFQVELRFLLDMASTFSARAAEVQRAAAPAEEAHPTEITDEEAAQPSGTPHPTPRSRRRKSAKAAPPPDTETAGQVTAQAAAYSYPYETFGGSQPTNGSTAHCHALTKAGHPCRNKPLAGSVYCRIHQPE
ncbi:MAG: wax ester/triacylglycerol synthase family O-acyltransferase [Anaerolineae bacterium]